MMDLLAMMLGLETPDSLQKSNSGENELAGKCILNVTLTVRNAAHQHNLALNTINDSEGAGFSCGLIIVVNTIILSYGKKEQNILVRS